MEAAQALKAAVLLDQLQLMLGVQHDPVEHRGLVEGPGGRALHRRPVVAPDVDDQGVVELTHLLDCVDETADVPVGILREAGEHLHLAGVQLLLGVAQGVPRGYASGRGARSVSDGTMPSFFWRSIVRSR